MTKKRVMIYVEVEDWREIRMEALRVGKSASRYLVDLYLNKNGGQELEAEKVELKPPIVKGKFFNPVPKGKK